MINLVITAIVVLVLVLAVLGVVRSRRRNKCCCDSGKSQCEKCTCGCQDSKADVKRTAD